MRTFATAPRREPRESRPCALCGTASFRPIWGDLGGYRFVRCRRCGLVQQNPQPLAAAVRARYDAAYLAYEAERQFDYRELELRALRDLDLAGAAAPLFSAAAATGTRPRALDVGCATGALLDALRGMGWDPLGVELSPEQAEYGRARFGLDIRAGTLEEAAFPAATFHLVHASHLIEHLNDPAAFLAECARVLAPGGILVLATPDRDGLQARLLGGAWRSAINDHLYLFSLRDLRALLGRAGFRIERSVTWGGWAAGLRPAFIKPFLDRTAKRLGLGDVRAVLARKD